MFFNYNNYYFFSSGGIYSINKNSDSPVVIDTFRLTLENMNTDTLLYQNGDHLRLESLT